MTLFNVYSLYPVEPVRGKGCFVYDAAGTEYLDLYGGHAVISIGHAQPDYVKAISEQAARLGFYSNSVENSLQTALAEKLGRASGYGDYSLFLCNSGAEANENALKLASFQTGRAKVLAFSKAFHGRTSGAVAATDNPSIRSPFNGTPNVEFAPLNDLEATRAQARHARIRRRDHRGHSGRVRHPLPRRTNSCARLRAAATERTGTQLADLDEIQSGYGRTGRFFAHQWAGIRPDLITTGQGHGQRLPDRRRADRAPLRGAPRDCSAPPSAAATSPARRPSPWLACHGAREAGRERRRHGRMTCSRERLRKLPTRPNDDPRPRPDDRHRRSTVRARNSGKKLLFGTTRLHGRRRSASTVRLLPALGLSEAQADEFVARLKALLEDFH